MSAVPMAGTGAGPRPDPTTFTRSASDQHASDRHAAERTTTDYATTARFADDDTTE